MLPLPIIVISACLAAGSPESPQAALGGGGAKPPAAAPAAANGSAAAVPGTAEVRKRAPLLREGSFVSRASGLLRYDEERGEWIFVPAMVERGGLQREFVLQPNETLADAIKTFRLAPTPISFETTGEVFIYHGRNYILPSIMVSVIPTTTGADPASRPGAAPADAEDKPLGAMDEEAMAEELERRLAERIATMPKAPTPAAAGAPATGMTAPRDPDGAAAAASIQSRRGHLVRDAATGGWRFVFDGQTATGGEPSMPVLPCLALERVEKAIRESEGELALVVTGTTTAFEGRTFLLPGIFRVASGGKGLNP